MKTVVRRERRGDEAGIRRLTGIAFEPMPYSAGTEARIIDDLRRDGDLTLSIVAVDDREIVGHIAFSPVTLEGGGDGWFGLGPVSVRPDLQRRGIGTTLVEEGLSILRSLGARGCVLIGDPDYYRRFGFRSDGGLTYRDLPSSLVQARPFGTGRAVGRLVFSPGFERR